MHAAFAGFTGVTVGLVNTHYVYLPIPLVIQSPRRVIVSACQLLPVCLQSAASLCHFAGEKGVRGGCAQPSPVPATAADLLSCAINLLLEPSRRPGTGLYASFSVNYRACCRWIHVARPGTACVQLLGSQTSISIGRRGWEYNRCLGTGSCSFACRCITAVQTSQVA